MINPSRSLNSEFLLEVDINELCLSEVSLKESEFSNIPASHEALFVDFVSCVKNGIHIYFDVNLTNE